MEVRALATQSKKTLKVDLHNAQSQTNVTQLSLSNNAYDLDVPLQHEGVDRRSYLRPTTNSINKRKRRSTYNEDARQQQQVDERVGYGRDSSEIRADSIIKSAKSSFLVNVICNNDTVHIDRNQGHITMFNSNLTIHQRQQSFQLQPFECSISRKALRKDMAPLDQDNYVPFKVDIQKEMRKTIQSQTNCFLPNYNQNHAMRKLQIRDPVSEIERRKEGKSFTAFDGKHKKKKLAGKSKKSKKLNLTVMNTMKAKPRKLQLDSQLAEPVSEYYMDTTKYQANIIKIQTALDDPSLHYIANDYSHSNLHLNQQSSPTLNGKSRIQVIQNPLDQTSSKLSMDNPSPINTDLAMFEDIRHMQPRNYLNLNASNMLQMQSVQRTQRIQKDLECNTQHIQISQILQESSDNGRNKLQKPLQSQTQRLNKNVLGSSLFIEEGQLQEDRKHLIKISDQDLLNTPAVQEEVFPSSRQSGVDNNLNNFLSRSIEVVIHRTSNSNSKVHTKNQVTPQQRNQTQHSQMMLTPQTQRINARQSTLQQADMDGSSNKKVIYRRSQVQQKTQNQRIINKSAIQNRQLSQQTQSRRLENIINDSDLSISPSQRLKLKPQISAQSESQKLFIKQESQDFRQDLNDSLYKICVESVEITDQLGLQHLNSSGTGKLANVYETVTQDSQLHKPMFENRYDPADGSPYIYRSREVTLNNNNTNQQHQPKQSLNLVLQLDRNSIYRQIQSHSVTPMCEPIYLSRGTGLNASKEELLMDQLVETSGNDEQALKEVIVDLKKEHKVEDSEDGQVQHNQQQVDFQDDISEATILPPDILMQLQAQDIHEEIYVTRNQDMIETGKPQSLQQQIAELRQIQVADQLHRHNPYIYQRRQDDEQERTVQNRIKKIQQREAQSLLITGTNIQPLSTKMIIALDYYQQAHTQLVSDIQNLTAKIPLVEGTMSPIVPMTNEIPSFMLSNRVKIPQNTDSQSNSDAQLVSGIFNNGNNPLNQYFMQNKYSFVSGQLPFLANQSQNLQHSQNMINSEPMKSRVTPNRTKKLSNFHPQSKKTSPQHAKKRYLSNEESRANLQPLESNTAALLLSSHDNFRRKYSPTPDDRTHNVLFSNLDLIDMQHEEDTIRAVKMGEDPKDMYFNNYTFDVNQDNSKHNQDQVQIHYEDQSLVAKHATLNHLYTTREGLGVENSLQYNNNHYQSLNQSQQLLEEAKYADQPLDLDIIYQQEEEVKNDQTQGEQEEQVQQIDSKAGVEALLMGTEPMSRNTYTPQQEAQTPKRDKIFIKNDGSSFCMRSKEEIDDVKIMLSYSKLMSKIGTDLASVGPKSLKQLDQHKNTMLSSFGFAMRKSAPQTQQGKRMQRRHEIKVNITASISTASFHRDQDQSLLHLASDELHTPSHNNYPSSSHVKIKQYQGSQQIEQSAMGKAQKPHRYNSSSSHLYSNYLRQQQQPNHYQQQQNTYINSSCKEEEQVKQVFEEPSKYSEAKLHLLKSNRLTNRITNFTKQALLQQQSTLYQHQGRRVVTTQHQQQRQNLIQSFEQANIINQKTNSTLGHQEPNQYSSLYSRYNPSQAYLLHPSSSDLNPMATPQQEHQLKYNIQSQAQLNSHHHPVLSQKQLQRPLTANVTSKPHKQLAQQQQLYGSNESGGNGVFSYRQHQPHVRYTQAKSSENQKRQGTIVYYNQEQEQKYKPQNAKNQQQSAGKSVNSNKLAVFKKLKKGTVFKDTDFEAKLPSTGLKIISLY